MGPTGNQVKREFFPLEGLAILWKGGKRRSKDLGMERVKKVFHIFFPKERWGSITIKRGGGGGG